MTVELPGKKKGRVTWESQDQGHSQNHNGTRQAGL